MKDYEQHEGDEPELDALGELDYDEGNYENRLLKYVTFSFVVAAIGGFVALAWYAYQSGMQPVNDGDIPLVEAQAGPIKTTPDEPGGLQFEHQDKAVYNQLASGSETPRMTEQLLAPPEQPIERPSAEEVLAKGMEPEPVKEGAATADPAAELVMAPAPEIAEAEPAAGNADVVDVAPVNVAGVAETKAEEAKAAAEAEAKVTTVTSTKDEEKTMEVIEAKPVKLASVETAPKPQTTAKAASGQFLAQLGAFRSEADAKAAWAKLAKAHSSKLGSQSHMVQRADLGSKGVFYRLQLGPFASDAAARDMCAYLQGQKQGCFVVK